jgi:imidazolonepropionase
VKFEHVWHGGRLATLLPGGAAFGLIEDGAVASKDGRIAYVGPVSGLPSGWSAESETRLDGRLVTPGLIDCHTHLVYGGSRANEFEMRLNGASYEEIARAGGGIVSTVKATRGADEAELVRQSLPRLDRLIGEGVTTIEIKSGYGLDADTEKRMLRAARSLAGERNVDVVTTYLGAHAMPPGATE